MLKLQVVILGKPKSDRSDSAILMCCPQAIVIHLDEAQAVAFETSPKLGLCFSTLHCGTSQLVFGSN
jgi:hypothetical protein